MQKTKCTRPWLQAFYPEDKRIALHAEIHVPARVRQHRAYRVHWVRRELRPTALAACQPDGGEEAATAPAADAAPGTVQVEALPTEKQQVSYMIGRDMARSLEEVKDDIDVDTLADAIRSGQAAP